MGSQGGGGERPSESRGKLQLLTKPRPQEEWERGGYSAPAGMLLGGPHTWLTFSTVAPENSGTGPKVSRTRFIPSLYRSQ